MKTLILNADSRPLSIISMKRAVVLDLRQSNIASLCYYDQFIKSASGIFKIPAVMMYSKYIKIPPKKSLSKKAVRFRDNNTCAYCNIKLDADIFTIDHIIPVSRFDNRLKANTWENVVSCCKKCNLTKGNKTPEEAGMELMNPPRKIDRLFIMDNIPKEWEVYM